jgi:hypothetical protein
MSKIWLMTPDKNKIQVIKYDFNIRKYFPNGLECKMIPINDIFEYYVIFFDAEDMGDSQGEATTWCLGSQYWAKTPHKSNYVARFGILLDMVGAENATFAIEGNSWLFAQPYVNLVWQTANSLGHSKHFLYNQGGQLIDDHLYINKIRGIPTLDIIHYEPSGSGFGDFWHTHDDNMSGISKSTLKAVGETVFKVVMDL